jgi:hypothetical protein
VSAEAFDSAENLLRDARRIYFLGFGFHPDNVRRLRVFEGEPEGGAELAVVSGTTRGITARDWESIRGNVLHSRWSGQRYVVPVPEFVRQYANLW